MSTAVMIDFNTYYAELLEALFSFDEDKIRNHLSAYNIALNDEQEDGLWHSVCEMLVEMSITPEDVREKAYEWLVLHGYRHRRGRNR